MELAGRPNCTHVKLWKINNSGEILWINKVENKCMIQANNVLQNKEGDFLIVGTSIPETVEKYLKTDIFIVKIDKNGETLWKKNIGTENNDYGRSIVQTSDNKLLILGGTYRNENSNSYEDLVIYNLNTNGEVLWNRVFKSKGTTIGNSILECKSKDIIITGQINAFGEPFVENPNHKEGELFLLKLDKNGNQK